MACPVVSGAPVVWGPDDQSLKVLWLQTPWCLSFQFVIMVRAGPHTLWGVILLCFSCTLYMVLPWCHICFISTQVTFL